MPRPAGHQYSFEVIADFLLFVLKAATSFRGASACLNVIKQRLGLERAPAPNTGESWLLRIGLHELTRPKEQADDWAWLADHSVQIGPHKCLLIAGVRLSAWQRERRPLEHQDLSILAVQPMLTSNGLTVAQALQETVNQHGEPRMIVTDEGSDLKKGIGLFQEKHARTAHVGDLAHKAALLVKRELLRDARWNTFVPQLGRSTQQAANTPVACLIAPALRPKARYMNVYEQVRWGQWIGRLLEAPEHVHACGVDDDLMQAKFGWVVDYQDALQDWDEMTRVVSHALEFIRVEGYHRAAAAELAARVGQPQSACAARIAVDLTAFVAEQSKFAHDDERLLGSTEVLESLFGKLKHLEGQQNRGGFTKLVLGLAASVAPTTEDFLSEAFSAVKNKDVWQWCDQHLGTSLQAQRHRLLSCPIGTKLG
jgi:hypothetical protein